ncbi:unnamed protein product [Brassica rapa subsp. trilocularis]
MPMSTPSFRMIGLMTRTATAANGTESSWFDNIHGYKSLGKLKKLEILDLSHNFVNNSVFLNAASPLKTLILHGNNNMKELKDLRNLKLLDLSGNMLSGPLPGLCQLKNLRELDLSRNEVIGRLPQCFSSLTKLEVLDISSNKFSGTSPSLISNLSSLQYLSLSDNEFEGVFSVELIANLSKLKVFKLSSRTSFLQIENKISLQPRFQLSVIELQYCNLETVPRFLQLQKDLRLINLSNNKLTRISPSWFLENYPRLQVLLLQNNSFTMLQFPRLLLNQSMQILDVSSNKFYQGLPESRASLQGGTSGATAPGPSPHMNLSNNGFQGNLPFSFGEMKKIEFLDLSHNNFSGTLPIKLLTSCYKLFTWKLSYNSFTGQIFSQPTKLTSMMVLIADNNQFTGIGDGLLNSTGLVYFDLSNNLLQGVIPSWFGGFHFMYFSASDNLINGTIPSSLFNIPFKLLDLSRNKFSGSLPSNFSGRDMGLLYLYDNEFSGLVPSTLLENAMLLDMRNNKLSGTIPHFNEAQCCWTCVYGARRVKLSADWRRLKNVSKQNRRIRLIFCVMKFNVKPYLFILLSLKILKDIIKTFRGVDANSLEAYSMSFVSRFLDLPLEFYLDYSGYLDFSVEFTSKRRYDSYTGESFDFIFGLDFSDIELSGEIPRELGDLQRMRALNLSYNSLSGLVPESFCNLTDI